VRRALKSVRRFVVVTFVRLAGGVVGLLPPRAARRLGRFTGAVVFRFSRRDRQRALGHLELAYGDELSEAERRRIAGSSFANLTGSLIELFSLSWRGPAGVMKLIGPDEDISTLEKPIAEGRGVLLFSAHFNNWELMGAYFAARGLPVKAIGRRLNDRRLDAMITRWRSRMGVETIYQEAGARPPLRHLREGGLLALLADQDVPRLAGEFVEFFGREAYTMTGPAALAVTAKAVSVGAFLVRKGDRHRLICTEAIEPPASGSKKERVLELTRRYTAEIERFVRAHPEQWAWMHRRWRSKKVDVKAGAGEA